MTDLRNSSIEDARDLKPGAEHYRAYVGPPKEYDLVGAMQFRLLTALGLREHHSVLDLGCGSLRAGRLLIPYLGVGRYFGLDPNAWLIEDAIEREIGADQIALKKPVFRHEENFDCAAFGEAFDFIIAQSIFSHTAADLLGTGLKSAGEALAPGGMLLATYVSGERSKKATELSGWIYPQCARFGWDEIAQTLGEAGLTGRPLPWRHPRQVWFAAVRPEDADRLPPPSFDSHLSGQVLGVPEYQADALSP